MAPKIKISYFPMAGRAEPTRLALAIGGIEFEDARIPGPEFKKMKEAGELMFGSFPVMHVDGVQYAQSDAMLRWASKQAGLYPEDGLKALKVDMAVAALEDILSATFKESSVEYRTKVAEELIPRYFGPVEKLYGETEGPYLLGEELSMADLKVYVMHTYVYSSGMVDHIPLTVLDQFPNLMKCSNAVKEHEKVKEWNAKNK